MSEEKTSSFEQDLARLEWIAGQLDEGDLDLDDSIKLFEEGQKLLKRCRDKLDKAQVKVQRLLESGDTQDLDPESLGR